MSVYLKCKAGGSNFSFEGKTSADKPYLAMNYTTQTGSESSQTTMSKAYIPLSTNSEVAASKKLLIKVSDKKYYAIGVQTTTTTYRSTYYTRSATSESTISELTDQSGFMISISYTSYWYTRDRITTYKSKMSAEKESVSFITTSLAPNEKFTAFVYTHTWNSKVAGTTATSHSTTYNHKLSNPGINYIAVWDNTQSISKYYTVSASSIEENTTSITTNALSFDIVTITGCYRFVLSNQYVDTATYTLTSSTSGASYQSYEEDVTITTIV